MIINSLTLKLRNTYPTTATPHKRKPCVWRRCFSEKIDLATRKERFLYHVKQRPSPCGVDTAEKGLIQSS